MFDLGNECLKEDMDLDTQIERYDNFYCSRNH